MHDGVRLEVPEQRVHCRTIGNVGCMMRNANIIARDTLCISTHDRDSGVGVLEQLLRNVVAEKATSTVDHHACVQGHRGRGSAVMIGPSNERRMLRAPALRIQSTTALYPSYCLPARRETSSSSAAMRHSRGGRSGRMVPENSGGLVLAFQGLEAQRRLQLWYACSTRLIMLSNCRMFL